LLTDDWLESRQNLLEMAHRESENTAEAARLELLVKRLARLIVQWHDPTFSRNLAWSINNHFYAFFNSF